MILRRYFGCSSLSVFYEIGVIKTSAKFLGKHIYRSLFSMKLQTFLAWLFFKLKTASCIFTAQKMKFSIKDFFSKRDQIRSLSSKDPCFSGSRFFRVKVFQCPGSGFRSNIFKLLLFLSFALFFIVAVRLMTSGIITLGFCHQRKLQKLQMISNLCVNFTTATKMERWT